MASMSDTSAYGPDGQHTSEESQQANASTDLEDAGPCANNIVRDYLLENVEEFRRLHALRRKGWERPEGDKHFKKQRQSADKSSEKDSLFFYGMMRNIAKDLNKKTQALNLSNIQQPALLDMCAAPGGFIDAALTGNPRLRVRAMSLPVERGGHKIRLGINVNVEFRDITTLADDMGITRDDIPGNFPGPHDFVFTKVFDDNEKYDLVFCDGQLLRTHQRAEWREPREANRLTLIQLALGLDHLNNGGSMIILMHKLDSWRCFDLIHQFSKMSTVQLFKHRKNHRIRSSFYLVAKNVQADSAFAKQMVSMWKQQYKIATFGTNEEYAEMHQITEETALKELEEFADEYVAMGKEIWKIQADGLENAAFMKHGSEG
ncbi:hypothetical protein F53441_10198 [Fusarium austroafricanum]|uniref:Ribosomal RNA methyltransferase FtsJ domain-containing protein n=1 Tax=Fusarium austroafricanum TaxID=2364996 RepID=A0A8H4K9E7_9HYPO|nr:hypothetical protein F53441_10198 [Fusarium austroafricanum]